MVRNEKNDNKLNLCGYSQEPGVPAIHLSNKIFGTKNDSLLSLSHTILYSMRGLNI